MVKQPTDSFGGKNAIYIMKESDPAYNAQYAIFGEVISNKTLLKSFTIEDEVYAITYEEGVNNPWQTPELNVSQE
jgi:cyclophilin family peptidyl-prolyl cis-trans isomerase